MEIRKYYDCGKFIHQKTRYIKETKLRQDLLHSGKGKYKLFKYKLDNTCRRIIETNGIIYERYSE